MAESLENRKTGLEFEKFRESRKCSSEGGVQRDEE